MALPSDASVAQRMELAQFAVQHKLWEGAKLQVEAVLKVEPEHVVAKNVLNFVDAELAKRKKK